MLGKQDMLLECFEEQAQFAEDLQSPSAPILLLITFFLRVTQNLKENKKNKKRNFFLNISLKMSHTSGVFLGIALTAIAVQKEQCPKVARG